MTHRLPVYGWPEFKRYAENVVCPCGMTARFERPQQRSIMWTEFGRRGRAVFVEKNTALMRPNS